MKTKQLNIRTDSQTKAKAQAKAKAKGISLSGYIRMLILGDVG